MNCPHCGEECACPHDCPTCEESGEACVVCEVGTDHACDLAESLAQCDHRRKMAPGGGDLVWCVDCGAYEWKQRPGDWRWPESVQLAKGIDGMLNPSDRTAAAPSDDSGKKIVN